MEIRTINQTTSVTGNRITGYASVFNSPTTLRDESGKQFREVVRPNAFNLEGLDVKCFFNHNRDELLGRTASGTLKLWQDNRGLYFDCTLPDYAKPKIQELCQRGDLTGCSFAFMVKDGGERWSVVDNLPFRELLNLHVDEVSVCVDPAYPTTSCAIRCNNLWMYNLKLKEIKIG